MNSLNGSINIYKRKAFKNFEADFEVVEDTSSTASTGFLPAKGNNLTFCKTVYNSATHQR